VPQGLSTPAADGRVMGFAEEPPSGDLRMGWLELLLLIVTI
jgi:hypothetical protein